MAYPSANARDLLFLGKPVGNRSVYPQVTVYTSANCPTVSLIKK